MPIPDELLGQMKGLSATDVDDDSLKKLEGTAVYQGIFNKGHATSTSQNGTKIRDAEAKVTAAEGKLTALKTEFDQFKAANPDKAAIDAQYQTQIATLNKEIEALKADTKNAKITGLTEGARQMVLSKLKETINPVHAESLVDRDSVKARFLSEDGETLRILQPGQQIPYAGDKDAQIKAIADELAKDVPATLRLANLPKGPGNGSEGGSGGSKKEKFDAIRERSANRGKKGGAKEGEIAPDPESVLKQRFGKR